MPRLPIYMDHNATTPCDPRVLEAMLPYFTVAFGNAASRNHSFGWEAEEAVKLARERVAALIGAEPGEIIFTSGTTEAANLALKGVFEMYASKGRHIISCPTEHKAVLDTLGSLERRGADVSWLEVGPHGQINLEKLEASIRPETVLIALMYANNETGTVYPVEAIGRIAKKHSVLFFCDASQAAGKIPVDVQRDGIDLLAMTAHKMYGPKGTGCLYVRRRNPRVRLVPQIDGGGHEKGLRSGTLNVPGIAGFGKACEICREEMQDEGARLAKLRDRMERGLKEVDGIRINGDLQNRLPHVSHLSFSQVDAEALLMDLQKEIAVSTGSACSSATLEPSHVLKAMGLDDEAARGSLRFSLGRFTTEEEIDYVVERVKGSLSGLLEWSRAIR